MSSKLKVNNIIPSTGTQIGISTTGGGINLLTGTVVTGIVTASGFDGPITQSGDFTIDDYIVHAGDTNTKFGFSAADTFSVETGGDERLRIKSNGFVGFGTDNPTRFLHVQDGSNTLLALDSIDTNADLVQSDTGGSTRIRSSSGALEFYAGGNASSTNATSSVKNLNITSAGVVQVIKPGSGGNSKLEITQSGGGGGTSEILFSDSVSGRGRIYYDHGSNPEGIKIEAAGTQTVIVTTAGKVGVGTAIPDETLELFKASGTNLLKVSSQANSTIGLLIEKTGSTTQSWKIADGQTANGTLEIYDATESETRLAIDGSGRVIIGQHSHSGGGTLVVAGNSNTPNAYGCAAFCRIQANPTSGTTLAQFRFSAGSGGTNRAAEISVQADSNWNDGTNQESKMIFTVASSGGGNTAGNPLMTLKGTGDVEVNRGNLVIGTGGKGIDFSVTNNAAGNTASMSNELLDDYEEGSWTPVAAKYSGGAISCTYAQQIGNYTKIGRLVTVEFGIQISALSSQGSNLNYIANLPYVPVASYRASGSLTRNSALNVNYANTCNVHADFGGVIYLSQATQTTAILNVAWQVGYLNGSITYITAS